MTFRGANSGMGGARFGGGGGISGMDSSSRSSQRQNRSRSAPHHSNSNSPCHSNLLYDVSDQPPDRMDPHCAEQLRARYAQKVDASKFQLVAGFLLDRGRIVQCHVYREHVPFELTERRRRLLTRYYSQGRQAVALYVNRLQFEHYMPLTGLRTTSWRTRSISGAHSSPGNSAHSSPSRKTGSVVTHLGVSSPNAVRSPNNLTGSPVVGGGGGALAGVGALETRSAKMTRTSILQRNTSHSASL